MAENFKKLLRSQLQTKIDEFSDLSLHARPKGGWIKMIREALSMSTMVLAKRLECSQSNITTIEQRERNGNITLNTLERVAQALNCKLVYGLIPNESLDQILEKQAKIVANQRIKSVNHSMKLEQQGLTPKQLQQQEKDLMQELLEGNLKDLWNDNEI